MKKQIYGYSVFMLVALLGFHGCKKEINYEPETVRELPNIVLRAREWVREHETLSRGRELEIGGLDFRWEGYALDSNSLGQAIVSVPARNSGQTGGDYMELAFGVDEDGVPQGMIKCYTGDMAGGSVLLHLYTLAGEKAMSGSYYPVTGRFSPRLGLGRLVKIAKAPAQKNADVDDNALIDGGTIEEVYVTANGSSSDSGDRSFGHWGSPGWGSFGGGGGSGGGAFGFDSGTNPIVIEPVYVNATRRSGKGGMVFPLFPRVEDFFVGNYGYGTPSPYYISVNFSCVGKGLNTILKDNVEKSLNNLKDGNVGRSNYGCFPSGILKAVQHKQGKTGTLTICLGTGNLSGAYDPSTKTLGYVFAGYVDDMITLHEILHYYQDLSGYYPNMGKMGKDQNGRTSKGFANIEFEVRLILDIMKGYGDEYVYELDGSGMLTTSELATINEGYKKFIESFRGTDKKLLNPHAMDMTKFRENYNRFLEYYATKSKSYRSEVDRNLEPKVLLELLKQVYNDCM